VWPTCDVALKVAVNERSLISTASVADPEISGRAIYPTNKAPKGIVIEWRFRGFPELLYSNHCILAISCLYKKVSFFRKAEF